MFRRSAAGLRRKWIPGNRSLLRRLSGQIEIRCPLCPASIRQMPPERVVQARNLRRSSLLHGAFYRTAGLPPRAQDRRLLRTQRAARRRVPAPPCPCFPIEQLSRKRGGPAGGAVCRSASPSRFAPAYTASYDLIIDWGFLL